MEQYKKKTKNNLGKNLQFIIKQKDNFLIYEKYLQINKQKINKPIEK